MVKHSFDMLGTSLVVVLEISRSSLIEVKTMTILSVDIMDLLMDNVKRNDLAKT